MRVLLQRAKDAQVTIDGVVHGKIAFGFVILVGFTEGDIIEDIESMAKKVVNLRVFDDDEGVMNRSLLDVGGEILSISQFTLYANTEKGRRPSYLEALRGAEATKLYDLFNEELRKYVPVETGVFGADMKVALTNDGPVTIWLESGKKHD